MFGAARLSQSSTNKASSFAFVGGRFATPDLTGSAETSYYNISDINAASGDFVILATTAWADDNYAPAIPLSNGFKRIYLDSTLNPPDAPSRNVSLSVSYTRLNSDSNLTKIYNVCQSPITKQRAVVAIFRPNGLYSQIQIDDINGTIESGNTTPFVINASSKSGPLLTFAYYSVDNISAMSSSLRKSLVPGTSTNIAMDEIGSVNTFLKFKGYNSSQSGEDIEIQQIDSGSYNTVAGFYLKLL